MYGVILQTAEGRAGRVKWDSLRKASDLRWLCQEQVQREASAAAANQTLAMADTLYQDGATSFLDVVVAQNAALGASQLAVAARTRRLIASIGLVRALGGGWDRARLPDAGGLEQAPPQAQPR